MLQRTVTETSNGATNQPNQPPKPPQWERVSAALSLAEHSVESPISEENRQTQTKRYECANCGRGSHARGFGRSRAMSSASSNSSLASTLSTVRGASFTASFTTSFASDDSTASSSSAEHDAFEEEGLDADMSVCSCGEEGCQCLCNDRSGPGPADLSFFTLPPNIRELAGVEEPAAQRQFCGPECKWSYHLKEELELGKIVKRKLLKKQRQQVAAEIAAKEATAANDADYRIDLCASSE